MVKRKREIDFIAAQKLLSKNNQSTSFEFILVVTVFVVACAMGGWYYLTYKQVKDKTAQLAADNVTLADAKQDEAESKDKMNNYQIVVDANGNPVIKSVNNKTGKVTYEYKSINAVATEIAEQLAAAQNASAEVKSTIDLTSAVLKTVIYGARDYNCTVLTFTYNNTTVSANISSHSTEAKEAYLRYLQGVAEPINGYDPMRYITGATISNEAMPTYDENNIATYTFTITFTVYSDSLYAAD